MNSYFVLDGALNFRHCTLDVYGEVEYHLDGGAVDHIDFVSLFVISKRRKRLVQASERLTLKLLEARQGYLEGQALEHSIGMAEYLRDMRRDNYEPGR